MQSSVLLQPGVVLTHWLFPKPTEMHSYSGGQSSLLPKMHAPPGAGAQVIIGSPPKVSQPLGMQTSAGPHSQLASLAPGQEKQRSLVSQAAVPQVPLLHSALEPPKLHSVPSGAGM